MEGEIQHKEKKKRSCKDNVKTQNLWGMILFPNFCCLFLMYIIIGLILIMFGGLMLGYALAINDLEIRYDDQCGLSSACTIEFTPSTTLKSPKLYYRVNNFYGNHRNFVKSLSYAQLRADQKSATAD